MINFAKAVSFFLHPVFILFPALFILVAKFNHDYFYALKWTIFSYAFVLIVVLFVVMGMMLGVFSNFDISKREQRPLLFSFSAFAAFCYLVGLLVLDGPKVLFIALFTIVFGLVVMVIVNQWIKASIHMATLTSVVLFVAIMHKEYFFLLLALIPLLAWSRVKLREHSSIETAIGSMMGMVVILIAYLVSKRFFLEFIYS